MMGTIEKGIKTNLGEKELSNQKNDFFWLRLDYGIWPSYLVSLTQQLAEFLFPGSRCRKTQVIAALHIHMERAINSYITISCSPSNVGCVMLGIPFYPTNISAKSIDDSGSKSLKLTISVILISKIVLSWATHKKAFGFDEKCICI